MATGSRCIEAQACTQGKGRLHHTGSSEDMPSHRDRTFMSAKHLVSLASRSVSVAVSEAASTAFVAVHRRARVYVPAHDHDGDARVHREVDVQEQGHRNNDRGAQSQGV